MELFILNNLKHDINSLTLHYTLTFFLILIMNETIFLTLFIDQLYFSIGAGLYTFVLS